MTTEQRKGVGTLDDPILANAIFKDENNKVYQLKGGGSGGGNFTVVDTIPEQPADKMVYATPINEEEGELIPLEYAPKVHTHSKADITDLNLDDYYTKTQTDGKITEKVGDLGTLATVAKDNVVDAINELKTKTDTIPTIQDGTLQQKGIVQLSSTLNEDENKAVTPKAVKGVSDVVTTNKNAIGTLGSLTTEAKNNLVEAINEVKAKTEEIPTIQDGTLQQKGIVQLTDTVDTNDTKAITPKGVKSVKDLVDTNKRHIGTVENLATNAKSDLVSAVNELHNKLTTKPTNTITVGAKGADFTDLQEALIEASHRANIINDLVYVNLISDITLRDPITITCNMNLVILQSDPALEDNKYTITTKQFCNLTSYHIPRRIVNIKFKGDKTATCIYISSADQASVQYCEFTDYTSALFVNNMSMFIENCAFENCGKGVSSRYLSSLAVLNCTFKETCTLPHYTEYGGQIASISNTYSSKVKTHCNVPVGTTNNEGYYSETKATEV